MLRLRLKVSAAVALPTLLAPVIAVVCKSSEDPATPKPAFVPLTGVNAPAPTLISTAEDGRFVVPTKGVNAAMALVKYAYSATDVCPGCRTQLVVTVIPAVRRAESLAGEMAEVDFGRLGLLQELGSCRPRVVQGFIMTLGYSRLSCVIPVFKQDLPTV